MSIPQHLKEARTAYGERNDCTVIALSIAAGVDYATAHEAMRLEGRRNCRGVYLGQQSRALARLGRKLVSVRMPTARTVTTLERALPSRGIFWAYTTGYRHVLACRAGKVLDWSAGRRHRIEEIYRVVPA